MLRMVIEGMLRVVIEPSQQEHVAVVNYSPRKIHDHRLHEQSHPKSSAVLSSCLGVDPSSYRRLDMLAEQYSERGFKIL